MTSKKSNAKLHLDRQYVIVLIVLCGLTASCTGICNNAVGVFYTSVSQSLGISRASVAIHATLSWSIAAVTTLFFSRLTKRANFVSILKFCILVAGISTIAMGSIQHVWMLNVLGCIRGVSLGAFTAVIVTGALQQWFHSRKGLMTSIVLSFAGIAGAIFAPFFSFVIEHAGWRMGYVGMGLTILLVNLPAFFCRYSFRPEDLGYQPYEEAEPSETTLPVAEEVDENTARKSFVLLLLLYSLLVAMTGISQHLPAYAESIGFTLSQGALLVSFCMFGNILSKLLFGTLSDKINEFRTTYIMLGVILVSLVLMKVASNIWVLNLSSFLLGFMYSIVAVGVTLLTMKCCGAHRYLKVYSMIALAGTVSAAISNIGIGALYDMTGSYDALLWIAFGITILECVLTVCLQRTNKSKH